MGKHSIGNHKVVCFTLWFATHNNPRHAALLPKLIPVVQFYKVTLSRQRVIQALQYRIWHALKRGLIYPVALRYFSQRFETLFTLEMDQISAWPRHKAIVIDVDDPVFSPTEIRFLNLPNVKAI